jgi:hypothetical protein
MASHGGESRPRRSALVNDERLAKHDRRRASVIPDMQGVPTGRPDAGLHGRACHDRLIRPRINAVAKARFHGVAIKPPVSVRCRAANYAVTPALFDQTGGERGGKFEPRPVILAVLPTFRQASLTRRPWRP